MTMTMTMLQEELGEHNALWVDCWQCEGGGTLDDCFEDTCVCIDPPCCETRCDVCRGRGGWWQAFESGGEVDPA